MLSCREVTKLMATEGVNGAPLRTRLSVRLHLGMCRHCRRYQRELTTIRDALRRSARTVVDVNAADRIQRIHAAVILEIRRRFTTE